MRRISYFVLPALAAATMFAVPAQAEPQRFVLDKPHTQVMFSVSHMGFSNSYGKFLDYEGVVNLDTAAPEKSNVDVTIKTASLDMGDQTWDEHMKAKDMFNVEQFPTMTFKSTKVEKTGDKTANVTGDLTLLGVTKPVTLAVTQNGMGKHPMKNIDATGFSATAKIKRSDFGMTKGIPMVGDDVNIIIEVEAYGEEAVNQ